MRMTTDTPLSANEGAAFTAALTVGSWLQDTGLPAFRPNGAVAALAFTAYREWVSETVAVLLDEATPDRHEAAMALAEGGCLGDFRAGLIHLATSDAKGGSLAGRTLGADYDTSGSGGLTAATRYTGRPARWNAAMAVAA